MSSIECVLTDYGGVLAKYQSDVDSQAMAVIVGMEWPEFRKAYWAHRAAYDRGSISVSEYWRLVTGRVLRQEVQAEVVAADIAGWSHPDEDVVAIMRSITVRVAMLSNAPLELKVAIERFDWLPPMEPRLYSCDLEMVKPEPAIYRLAAQAIGTPPDEILFVDDRMENVEGAQRAGLQAVLFSHAEKLRADLEDLGVVAAVGALEG